MDDNDKKFFDQFNYHINEGLESAALNLFARSTLSAMRDMLCKISATINHTTEEEEKGEFKEHFDFYFDHYLTDWTDRYGTLANDEEPPQPQ